MEGQHALAANLHNRHVDIDEEMLRLPQILVLGLVRFRAIGFGGMGHHVTAKRRVEFDKFYKNPKALVAAPANLRLYLALGADAVGALLFVALFGLVRRADDP